MNGRMKAYVYPENPDSAGLLERYRENWGLLHRIGKIFSLMKSQQSQQIPVEFIKSVHRSASA